MSNIDNSWCKLYMYNLWGIEAVVIVVLTVVLTGALVCLMLCALSFRSQTVCLV
jgi:hypothetical protein